MLIDTDNLEKGCIYSVGVDGTLWRYFPRINLPLAKKINITTGEIIYPTNADRIRNMSDEELAKFLQEDVFYEPWCPDDVVCLIGEGCQLTDKDCGKCALKWLKQGIKNDR